MRDKLFKKYPGKYHMAVPHTTKTRAAGEVMITNRILPSVIVSENINLVFVSTLPLPRWRVRAIITVTRVKWML